MMRFFLSPVLRFKKLYFSILGAARVPRDALVLLVGLMVGWWVYVPLHELMHAAGCLLAGGAVVRLEVAPIYGGAALARIFDFVVSGGPYAGRLSGFDTHGSDWIYWVTVFLPYLLTLPGFFFLETAAVRRWFFLFAVWLPATFAPLVSLTGDFFELGSLSLFQVWPGPGTAYRGLISDDLFLLLENIYADVNTPADSHGGAAYLFIAVAFFLGLVMAWGTLLASVGLAGLARRRLD